MSRSETALRHDLVRAPGGVVNRAVHITGRGRAGDRINRLVHRGGSIVDRAVQRRVLVCKGAEHVGGELGGGPEGMG